MRRLTVVRVDRNPLALLGPLWRALHGEGPAVVPVDNRIPPALDIDRPLSLDEDNHDDPTAVMIPTSGSTGEPKGVLLPSSALRASAEATHSRLGGPGRWLLATPAQYVGGLQVLVRSLLAGTAPGFVDMSNGFVPGRFAAAARPVLSSGAPCYTAIVPTQLTRILDAGREPVKALRAFDAVLVGGAATSDELRSRAIEAGIRVVPAYGMSETAGGCVYDGRPLDGVRVRLIEGPAGDIVAIGGAVLARGYRADPDGSARAFAHGWFHTGDLGELRPDGRLTILGRTDDVINTGGVKVSPVPVERAIAGVDGVIDVCVVGTPDPEWGQAVVAAVIAESGEVDARRLADAVRAEVGPTAVPKRFVFLDELPTRGPGKPDRAALHHLLTRESNRPD